MIQPDFKRRTSHAQALLELLLDGRWHGMREVQNAGGWRYSARICEMRKAGYEIETRNVFGDVFEYRMLLRAGQMQLL